MFPFWGIREFSCDSQYSFFSFQKGKNDTMKRTAVEFKEKENIASSYSHS